MKKPLILLVLLIVAHGLFAQGSTKPKVMIIPFDPDMYFSDADQDFAKDNKKNVKEVRTALRMGLNNQVNGKALAEYETRPLLNDTMADAAKDLYAIYKSIRYFKDKAKADEHDVTRNNGGSIKKQFAKKEADGGHNTSSLIEVDKDGLHTYINVKVYDVKMLDYLHNKYGTEVFLFLNQFNLVTDFTHPDESTMTYKREIGVHYSVFDYTGKQLAGDIVITSTTTSVRDINAVIKNVFPALASGLVKALPGHVKIAPETDEATGKNKEKKQ